VPYAWQHHAPGQCHRERADGILVQVAMHQTAHVHVRVHPHLVGELLTHSGRHLVWQAMASNGPTQLLVCEGYAARMDRSPWQKS
jgi:hypothetical protein